MRIQWIVTSAVIYDKDKVLIVKRAASKKFMPGVWEIPGGRVEIGETVPEALKREVSEELHIDINPLEPIYCFNYCPQEDVYATEIDYLAELNEPSQELKLNPEDHSDMRWVSESELDEFFDPTDENYKAIKAAFKRLTSNEEVALDVYPLVDLESA